MKNRGYCCPLVYLLVGATCLTLFLAFDHATGAIGRYLLKMLLQDSFRGDCSQEPSSLVRIARSLVLPFTTIPPILNGLHLGILISPFQFEDKEGTVTFTEMGPWALHVEVDNEVLLIMQEPERSITTVRQPIYNFNLQMKLLPLVLEDMELGIPVDDFQKFPLTLQNMSIVDRVWEVWNNTQLIMRMKNYTAVEINSLREAHTFLSGGKDSALLYDGTSLYVAERSISSIPNTSCSFLPILRAAIQYHFPGFRDVTWENWGSGYTSEAGVLVDRYRVKDFWKPSLLCQFSNRFLLNLQKRFSKHGFFLASPGSLQSKNFIVKWWGEMPFSAILDVYRPFSLPVGGTLAVDVNTNVTSSDSHTLLKGQVTPVMRVTVTLKALPEIMWVWLVHIMRIRTVVLTVLIVLAVSMFVAAVISYVMWGRVKHVTLEKLLRRPL